MKDTIFMQNHNIKFSRVIAISLVILCLIAIVVSLISIVKIDFAADHYEITADRDAFGRYGCYKYECKYCRGRDDAKKLTEFAYYRNMIYVRNASITVAAISGVAALGTCVFVGVKNKRRQYHERNIA